jgi:hypothetical protein
VLPDLRKYDSTDRQNAIAWLRCCVWELGCQCVTDTDVARATVKQIGDEHREDRSEKGRRNWPAH